MSEGNKKEELFKILEDIKDKHEYQSKKQLDAIKHINFSSKLLKTFGFFSTLNDEAKTLMVKIKQLGDWLDTAQLVCTKTDGKTKYDFSHFTFPSKIAFKIYKKDLMLQEAKDNQQELKY